MANLGKPRKRSFARVLAKMPNVGKDSDFERLDSTTNACSSLAAKKPRYKRAR
jgi:hypothetical protein